METRRNRVKRAKYADTECRTGNGDISDSNDPESLEDLRKSRIRDSNKEYAKRMTILQSWSDYWSDYTTREGDAYPKKEVLQLLKKSKKVLCPIETCRKTFTTFGGLRYHYARCNIERCFKCNVCNPPSQLKTKGDLLRHMVRSHYNDMPALDNEQKEIAQAYLSTSGRIDKSKKRINGHESNMDCRGVIKSFYEMSIKATNDQQHQDKRPYKDWLTLSEDWELVTYDVDRLRYYPPEKESPHLKISPTTWQILKAGESILFDSRPDTTIDDEAADINLHLQRQRQSIEHQADSLFFTGGVSTSAAWLPKPSLDVEAQQASDLLAVSVNCCPMDKSLLYKDCKDLMGCVQFWTMQISPSLPKSATSANSASGGHITAKPELAFMMGHNWGNIFDMIWCPLGSSWQKLDKQQLDDIASSIKQEPSTVFKRCGILALACGDGTIRLISVPHVDYLLLKSSLTLSLKTTSAKSPPESPIDSTPMYSVKPIGCLSPPGVGQSTDSLTPACTSICWNLEDNQRVIAAGYSNGSVALFDLSNYSPILYTPIEHYHVYRPFKTWFAHGLPVSGVGLLSDSLDRILVATGSRDRQLKIWNSRDLNSCLASDRSPITRVIWDYRFKGIVSSTEAAFTSFQNRVSYRYPSLDDSNTTVTIATHRATVWGLNNSILTSSLVTSDEAGEVIVSVYGRPIAKRERNPMATHCVFTLLPRARHSLCDVPMQQRGQITGQTYQSSMDDDPRLQTITDYRTTISVDLGSSAIEDATAAVQGGGDMMNAAPTSTASLIHHGQVITNSANELIITMPIVGTTSAESGTALDLDLDENNQDDDNNQEDVYGITERPVANKPALFLLPIEHRAVETYEDFKRNFGLEFVDYDQTYPRTDQQLPDSSSRASDLAQIYCDRVCDYPFSSIKHVSFSPNANSFSYLMSVSHVGLCRVGKVKIIEHFYKSHVETTSNNAYQQLAKQPASTNNGCG